MGKTKTKKNKKRLASSDESETSNSSSDSSREKKKLRKLKKKLKKEQRKTEKMLKRKLKEEKKKLKKKKRSSISNNEDNVNEEKVDNETAADIPIELMEKSKAMAPMTKEEWDKRQSVVRRVLDEESGRYRLIKGDGEVLEEIVSQDRHKEINRQATKADGDYFKSKTGLSRIT